MFERLSFLWKFVEYARKFDQLGMPPDLTEEEALRLWAVDLVAVLDEMADETVTELDDQVVAFLGKATRNDLVWEIFLPLARLIQDRLDGGDDPILVGASSGNASDLELRLAGDLDRAITDDGEEQTGNPLVILTIVSTIVQVLRYLRDRRRDQEDES